MECFDFSEAKEDKPFEDLEVTMDSVKVVSSEEGFERRGGRDEGPVVSKGRKAAGMKVMSVPRNFQEDFLRLESSEEL